MKCSSMEKQWLKTASLIQFHLCVEIKIIKIIETVEWWLPGVESTGNGEILAKGSNFQL